MMQKSSGNSATRIVIRVLAALIALGVIGGSILWFARPEGKESGASWLPKAMAEDRGFVTLKKGSSGIDVNRSQLALRDLGYYTGKVDGNFSKVFEEAVMAFQEDFGLEKTGRIDEETFLLITEGVEASPDPKDSPAAPPEADAPPQEEEAPFVTEGESYSDKDHVAAYLRAFGELPPNYITKREAQDLGWENRLGNLWEVAPGKSIGGDRFGNYEGQLPAAKGRKYFECDIDFDGGYRNGKRIIFSSDGLIFYTEDHYNTFEEITE